MIQNLREFYHIGMCNAVLTGSEQFLGCRCNINSGEMVPVFIRKEEQIGYNVGASIRSDEMVSVFREISGVLEPLLVLMRWYQVLEKFLGWRCSFSSYEMTSVLSIWKAPVSVKFKVTFQSWFQGEFIVLEQIGYHQVILAYR